MHIVIVVLGRRGQRVSCDSIRCFESRRGVRFDSPLDIALWFEQVRSVDFTIGYEVRPSDAPADSPPAVLATTQMAMVTRTPNAPLRPRTIQPRKIMGT